MMKKNWTHLCKGYQFYLPLSNYVFLTGKRNLKLQNQNFRAHKTLCGILRYSELIYIILSSNFRAIEISNTNRSQSCLDAGSVLFQRKGRTFSQHHYAKRLHSYISIWFSFVQYKNIINTSLSNESKVISTRSTSLFTADGKL